MTQKIPWQKIKELALQQVGQRALTDERRVEAARIAPARFLETP